MRNRLFTVALLAFAVLALTAPAASLAKDNPSETAVYAVANLDKADMVKDLTKALTKVKGVTAAKADAEAGKFIVTFNPEKTNPDALTAVVTKVAADAKFEGVQAAEGSGEKSGCGACPSKATCGKKK